MWLSFVEATPVIRLSTVSNPASLVLTIIIEQFMQNITSKLFDPSENVRSKSGWWMQLSCISGG